MFLAKNQNRCCPIVFIGTILEICTAALKQINPLNPMRRLSLTTLALLLMALVFSSCSSGISIQDAAGGGKAKCGKNHLR
jgi:hypothetical protein